MWCIRLVGGVGQSRRNSAAPWVRRVVASVMPASVASFSLVTVWVWVRRMGGRASAGAVMGVGAALMSVVVEGVGVCAVG